MFVSTFPTLLPTVPLRSYPFRYGARTPFIRTAPARPSAPAVTGRWADDGYELTADFPGVPEDAVAVTVAGRTLSIDVATNGSSWNERIRLPHTLDPEQVSARYVNGRLTVTVGKVAEAEPRSIAVETTPAVAELAAEGDQSPSPAGDHVVETGSSVTG